MSTRDKIILSLLVAALLLLALASFLYGGAESISDNSVVSDYILKNIRFPKAITAIFAGATLALSGLVLQIIFRNPLAGPYVLGVSSGAALFVALGMMAGGSFQALLPAAVDKLFIVFCAVLGSLVTTLLILVVAKKVVSNVILLLIGLMISQIYGAVQMGLEYFADPYSLKLFVIWGMGSLSNCSNDDLFVFVPLSITIMILLFLKLKPLSSFLYGQEYALSMGINYKKERFWLLLAASVLTGLTTAFCGPIAFVGIAVPILSRMLFTNASLWLHFFACVLLGAIVMLLADVVSNNCVKGFTMPVNIVTTLIGAPLVIYLMFKNKQW